MRINLRDYYPFYTNDVVVEVSDEIASLFMAWQHEEQAARRQVFRYQAHYSLDRNDGIENERLDFSSAPDAIYEAGVSQDRLKYALSLLPVKQAKRIKAHYMQGINKAEIARAEGVTKGAVTISIQRGIRTLKMILKNFV